MGERANTSIKSKAAYFYSRNTPIARFFCTIDVKHMAIASPEVGAALTGEMAAEALVTGGVVLGLAFITWKAAKNLMGMR
jgi:hypothetical protein